MRLVRSHGLAVLTLGIVVTLAVVLPGSFPGAAPDAAAQDNTDTCQALVTGALTAAQEACSGLAPGEICYVHPGATITAADGTSAALEATGDTVAVSDVVGVSTMAADPDSGAWGITVAQLPAGLADGGVTAVLFGGTEISRPTEVAGERPTIRIWNEGGAPINLRNGAGVGYELVTQLQPGDEAVADGRNEQSDWVRVRFNDSIAWVFVPLISWDGDVGSLDVLAPTDVSPVLTDVAPFEVFTLATAPAPAACSEAPSGLMLQYTGEETARLIINGATLEFADATLIVNAVPGGSLDVMVLAGSVSVSARGIAEEASSGDTVSVSLGGDDGLTAAAVPSSGGFGFAEIAYQPVGLLPGTMSCVVGVIDPGSDVKLRVGPGVGRAEMARMTPDLTYAVTGYTYDPDGNPWWELDTGAQASYVDQSEVIPFGACDVIAEVEAPGIIVSADPPPNSDAGADAGAGTGGDAASGGEGDAAGESDAAASGPDFAPTGNSVWQMVPGADQLSGDCSGAPAINFCDHLAAIAPITGGISWKGMEALPYNLALIQPNVYYFEGRNILNTGNISLRLTFSSETTLNMTMILTLDSEPSCQHTYFYTGTRNW